MINSTFSTLRKPSEYLAQAQSIVTSMTGNPAFPEPWPSTVPALSQIQADLTAYQNAVTATAAGDRTRITERNATRETLGSDLTQLGFYVQNIAKGDAAMLATTGFPLRQRGPRTQSLDPPPAPDRIDLARGTVSGTLIIRAGRVPNAGSYDVQMTSADPTVDTNWATVGSYKNCRRIDQTGLTSLKTWSVRMRALGAAGPGAWSAPVSLLVL